jgi:small subunit ribosomal protein S16
MTRTGATNDVSFRIVATDSRSPRDGKMLEQLGWYDPKRKGTNFSMKLDRVDYWLAQGAKPSEAVNVLLRKQRKATPQAAPAEAAAEAPAEAVAEAPAAG